MLLEGRFEKKQYGLVFEYANKALLIIYALICMQFKKRNQKSNIYMCYLDILKEDMVNLN